MNSKIDSVPFSSTGTLISWPSSDKHNQPWFHSTASSVR